MHTFCWPTAQQHPLFLAWLSKLTAPSMCRPSRITSGRYKRTRGQSKAAGSTGVDSGQLLEVIEAFEPESNSKPPFVSPQAPLKPGHGGVYFDFGPQRPSAALFISAGRRGRESEAAQVHQILVHQWWTLHCRPGRHVWPLTLDLEFRKKRQISASVRACSV